MAYPLISAEGNVASWGSANFYSVLLSKLSNHSATINVLGDAPETTAFNVTRKTFIPGLKQWNFSIRGLLYVGTPTVRLGNVGLVSFSAGGFSYIVDEYEVTLETDVHDITGMVGPSSPKLWRDWRPDILRGSGVIRGHATSDGTIVAPPDPTASLPTLTLTYGDEATDDTLAGSVVLTPLTHTMNRGEKQRVEFGFQFTGDITAAGTGSPLGSGVLGAPSWSAGGAAVGAIVIDSESTDQRYSGTDSFYRSITIRCSVGEPVEFTIEGQGTDTLTLPT